MPCSRIDKRGNEERGSGLAADAAQDLTDQLPVQLILDRCERDAFRGDEFCGIRWSSPQRPLHRRDEGVPEMADDFSSWRLRSRMKPKGSQQSLYKLDVVRGLLVGLLELLTQLVLLHATERVS
jgi:hypothetical protein